MPKRLELTRRRHQLLLARIDIDTARALQSVLEAYLSDESEALGSQILLPNAEIGTEYAKIQRKAGRVEGIKAAADTVFKAIEQSRKFEDE